jgi:hypothetical protein
VMMMRKHIPHQSASLLLHMSVGLMVSHGIQCRGNTAVLGNVLLCPMMHRQSTESTEGRTLDMRVGMVMVHGFDDGMNSV